jgi:hypothetical protein
MVREGTSAVNTGRPAKAGLESVQAYPNHGIVFSPTKEGANMVKQGANTQFIATYLFNNPGTPGAQVRSELCKARGIDPGRSKRGHYTCYFYTNRFAHLWKGGAGQGFYLTERGLAQVQA